MRQLAITPARKAGAATQTRWSVALAVTVDPSAQYPAHSPHTSDTQIDESYFLLAYDPHHRQSWGSSLRIATVAHTDIETDIATDPLFASSTWNDLVQGLTRATDGYYSLHGSVSCSVHEFFPHAPLDCVPLLNSTPSPKRATVDLRASWSPRTLRIGHHFRAWVAVLEKLRGLEPEGVASLLRAHG